MDIIYKKIFSFIDNNKNYLVKSLNSLSDSSSENEITETEIYTEQMPSSISSEKTNNSSSEEFTKSAKSINPNIIEKNKITSENSSSITKSEKSHTSEDTQSDKINEKMTIETVIEKKYINSGILNKKKYYEEIKELEKENLKNIEINIIKNKYSDILKSLDNGETLYKKDINENIIKLCCNKNCENKCEKEKCCKSGLYYSLWNNNRGIKTIYNLFIKLLILYPEFRNKCKCCEENDVKQYFIKLEEKYNKNTFVYEETNLKKIEFKINFLINKFMTMIGLMTCQCKFKNKYHEFYQENYLNFMKIYHNYKKTIPFITILLKQYFNIKENHEELILLKQSRCIHEDIKYNNFTYCLKKEYSKKEIKKINEIINNIELVDIWTNESFKITMLLFNQQSLETFRNILYKYKKGINIIDFFNKIYNKKNSILNLNFISNKKSLINSILFLIKNNKNNKNFELNIFKQLINTFITQLYYRNKKTKDYQNKLNILMFQYLIDTFNNELIQLGLEFIKNIKNIDTNDLILKINNNNNLFNVNLNKKYTYVDLIKYIFNTVFDSDVNYQIKISYLKIINKNNINIIEYDFIDKLIDIDEGEKIITEMTKYKQNIKKYSSIEYVNTIIKKCVIKKRVNLLNYILFELNGKIKDEFNNLINPYLIYFKNLTDYKKENDYIDMLVVMTKYKYDINVKINIDNIDYTTNNNYSLLHFCIKNNFYNSAKILINNFIDISIICENKNILFYCVDYKNFLIFNSILNTSGKLVNDVYNKIKLFTYILKKKDLDENLLMRFLIKIIKIKEFNKNYQDDYNTHIGFQILNSNISKKNKILLFKLSIEDIEPLIIKDNIPLILYSLICDEYEITYLLLNKMITNKMIKNKNNKNDKNYNALLDYECINDNITINFIPAIFKYIKENTEKNKINLEYLYLEVDIYTENMILIILEFSVFILLSENDKKNINKINNIDIIKNDELNGYLAIDKNISDNETIENGYMEISINEDLQNKNIWKKRNNEISIQNIDTITYNSESSEIEESEICFTNFI
jgi:hypothetical protein